MWTALEAAILNRLHEKLGSRGFPAASSAKMLSRSEDDSGRIITFASNIGTVADFPAGEVDAFSVQQVTVHSLPAGLSFTLEYDEARTYTLDLIVNGNYRWDNHEAGFKLLMYDC